MNEGRPTNNPDAVAAQRSGLRFLPAFLHQQLGSELDRSFAASSLGALSIRVAGTAILLLLQVLLTRILGPEHFGDYIYVLSWANLLAAFGACGMDTASLRFVAAYEGTGQMALLRGFLRRSLGVVLLASLVLAGALAGIVFLLSGQLSQGLRSTFFVACLLLPVVAVLLLLASLLRGFKQVVLAMAPQFVLRPLLLSLIVLVLHFALAQHLTAVTVMCLDLAVALGLAATMFYLLHRRQSATLRRGERRYDTRLWMAAGLPLLAITGIRMMMSKVDILMIGLFLGTTAAGIYAIATQLATLISFGLFAVNMIAAPLIAQLHAQDRMEELQRIVRLGARATFTFSLLTGAVLLIFGKPILRLFGSTFVSAYAPLAILILGQIVNSLAGSVGFIMTMTANEREAARVTALTGVLNVLLAATLIPLLGLAGAALATVSAGIVWNVVLVIRVRRRLRINSTAFSRLHR